jgi:thiol-disulfide isomerase/thioredoxin
MRHIIRLLILALIALVSSVALAQDETPGATPVDSEFAGRADLPAPEFPPNLDWINVPAPLTMEALRGKIVLFDFWTYGCINCIHMIPTLERLEEKYGNALVIIGVHSAKFENEGETENIRQIVQRYNLAHPVINDSDFVVWQTYGVNAWPTFVVIDPRGNVLARQAGEIPFEAFDRVIGGMVEYFTSTGELNTEPLELALEGAGTPRGVLAFPGKVLADEAGNRLFIADSNHHRIIIADLTTYEVLDVIGSGVRGFEAGTFDQAQFNKPQGMALRGDVLYVADTENHAVRAVDLAAETVTTVAGTGEQSFARLPFGEPQPAATTAISSPWDVAFGEGDTLYIAMAGVHQIWSLDVANGTIAPSVGNGREALINRTLAESELAQPSGLFFRDGVLYFADSESSTIRAADVPADQLRTLAGTLDNNLFDFGDVDGAAGESRLQHPLGVTGGASGDLFVADTYNSTIKRLDPAADVITTLTGAGGSGGYRDGTLEEAEFDEPGGLSLAGNRLFVADTNNHAIRVIDLDAGTVETLAFPNPEALQFEGETTVIGGNAAEDVVISLPAQNVAAGAGEIVLRIVLPEGYKINDAAPSMVEWSSADEALEIASDARSVPIESTEQRFPVTLREGDDMLYGTVTVYYCEAVNETLCFIDEVGIEAPVTVSAEGTAREIVVERTITPPEVEIGGL